jgi:hypothetical protein
MRSSREGMDNRILRVYTVVVSSQEPLSTAQVCRKSGLCLFPDKCSHNQAREILKGLVDTEEIDEHGTGRSWKLYSKKGLLPATCKIVRFCKAKSLREMIVEHGQEFKEARLEVQTYEKSNRKSHGKLFDFVKKTRDKAKKKINGRIDRVEEKLYRSFKKLREELDPIKELREELDAMISMVNKINIENIALKAAIREGSQTQIPETPIKRKWGVF